ncbi:hypothetical protein GCM10010129_84370 [Streptomyces fumigatiscleroticus]|nr:hypothetical protein GCM10010129_84370 [Streptomyces fumigatiscleroticus]
MVVHGMILADYKRYMNILSASTSLNALKNHDSHSQIPKDTLKFF